MHGVSENLPTPSPHVPPPTTPLHKTAAPLPLNAAVTSALRDLLAEAERHRPAALPVLFFFLRGQHPGRAPPPDDVGHAGRLVRVSPRQHGVFRRAGRGGGGVPGPRGHHPQLRGGHGRLPVPRQEGLAAGERRYAATSSAQDLCFAISCPGFCVCCTLPPPLLFKGLLLFFLIFIRMLAYRLLSRRRTMIYLLRCFIVAQNAKFS